MDNLGRLVVERALSRVWCCVPSPAIWSRVHWQRDDFCGERRGGRGERLMLLALCGVLARQLCPSHIQN